MLKNPEINQFLDEFVFIPSWVYNQQLEDELLGPIWESIAPSPVAVVSSKKAFYPKVHYRLDYSDFFVRNGRKKYETPVCFYQLDLGI